MSTVLGVGVIGASAERGWAKDSHIPAVQGLAGLQLVAVAAGNEQKADAAARTFDAKKGYASGFDLIRDPAVDIVTVAVKGPDHRELVLAAVSEGKHVYCEWPLGRDSNESEELANAAASAGVRTAIGLQMRSSAAVARAHKILDEGKIGRPLTASIVSNTAAFGPSVEPAMVFAEDVTNGVTLVSIQGAHTFDLAMAVLGQVHTLSALATTQFPTVNVANEPSSRPRTIPDHIFLQALLRSGVPVGIEVAGGRSPNAPTRLTIAGTEGTLSVLGGAMRGVQSGRLQLLLNDEPQHLDEGEKHSMPDAAANVAGIYAMLRDDIAHGTSVAPDFAHAVHLARFLDVVLFSSETGTRQVISAD